jgi:hypothetical protein
MTEVFSAQMRQVVFSVDERRVSFAVPMQVPSPVPSIDGSDLLSTGEDEFRMLEADGGGGTRWTDPPAGGGGVTGPGVGNTTVNAIATWADTDGIALLNTVVTVDGAGNAVIPSGGSISKPGTGASSEAFGAGALAGGANAVAVGNSASVAGADSIGIGCNVSVPAPRAIGIGCDVTMSSNYDGSISIGEGSSVSLTSCVAIGGGATEAALGGTAVGANADAASSAVAIGANSDAGDLGVAIGVSSDSRIAAPHHGIAIGYQSRAYKEAVVIGFRGGTGTPGNNLNTSAESVCVGSFSYLRTYQRLVSVGAYTDQNANDAIVIGHGAASVATHTGAVAIGRSAATTAASRVTLGTIGGSYDLELQVGKGLGVWGSAPAGTQPTYLPTNVTPDRAYDANSTTLAEIADVLGTVIADLQATGIFG